MHSLICNNTKLDITLKNIKIKIEKFPPSLVLAYFCANASNTSDLSNCMTDEQNILIRYSSLMSTD